ncbi:hypothetical protein [Corallococcus silvisoli]|uniref:hypothetical protein n=1 Tax=Corallococcus silvisoli TaxID=2697031 RepID=UPI00191BF3DA|nr:hypothetical protein [Corallococcus silvisoli]
MDSTPVLQALFDSLQARPRPEDVADLVLQLAKDLSLAEHAVLERAARGALRRGLQELTSMAEDFDRPVAPERQVRKAVELFQTARALSPAECADVEKVRVLVRQLAEEIHKTPGRSDFSEDRLSRKERKASGMEVSRRRYNKLFRFVCRFERKVERLAMEQRKYEAMRIAKSSLATRIRWTDFAASREAACFVAYFTARCNRRSVFTSQSQDAPFDDVARMLLTRFLRAPCREGWLAIAHVMPDLDIVRHLDGADRLALFGTWTAVLGELARLLERTWARSQFNRATMVVSRGDDSSTWNALAGAWNASRQGWLALVHALGMADVAEQLCFGKVMRLMAADVAAWHRADGGGLEPDTLVWAALPAPWEVFSGKVSCTRAQVVAVCRAHGVDPEAKHWTFPRHGRRAVPFKPTPELVHGVVVSHPELASMLRKAGWFSGKDVEPLPEDAPAVRVERDAAGSVRVVHADDKARD